MDKKLINLINKFKRDWKNTEKVDSGSKEFNRGWDHAAKLFIDDLEDIKQEYVKSSGEEQ